MKAETDEDLAKLYAETSFHEDNIPFRKPVEWENIDIENDDDFNIGFYSFVPQGSTLGSTLIQLGDTYENSGYDCLFIQELLRLYQDGKLKIVK